MCNPSSLLHYEYFPHVLEAILEGSSHSTKLAFRRTCRSLRNRVDRLLARHLVLTDSVRTAYGKQVPFFSPFSTHRPIVKLLDVHGDPDQVTRAALQQTRLQTVRVFGRSHADFNCTTLVLHSLHQLPPSTSVRTLVLNVTASGYVHFVTTAMGRCLTLVVPRELRVMFLDREQRRRIRMISIEEWEAGKVEQSRLLEFAN